MVKACQQEVKKLMLNTVSAGSGSAALSIAGSRLCSSAQLQSMFCAETTPRHLLLQKYFFKLWIFQAVTVRSWAAAPLLPAAIKELKTLLHYSAAGFYFIFFKNYASL